MSIGGPSELKSVEEYLEDELTSATKREYVAGAVYEMKGFSNLHNRIAGNVLGCLFARRRKDYQPFNSATKIRIRSPNHIRFYYPDASLTCRPNPPDDFFQDEPAVVIEILSDETRRIDQVEKKDAYLTIPSLSVYLLIEKDKPIVTVFRRTDSGFVRELYEGTAAVISLSEIDAELPLSEIFESVEFVPERGD